MSSSTNYPSSRRALVNIDLGASAVEIVPDPGVDITTSLIDADTTLVLNFDPPLADQQTYAMAMTDAVIGPGPGVEGRDGVAWLVCARLVCGSPHEGHRARRHDP